jgi:hypothetical protein
MCISPPPLPSFLSPSATLSLQAKRLASLIDTDSHSTISTTTLSLRSFGCAVAPECECGSGASENVQHFLLHCLQYDKECTIESWGTTILNCRARMPSRHLTNHQIVRSTTAAIPTLLGGLLFLKDSEESSNREGYYCILASLFFPWSRSQPIKSDDTTSWK